MQSSAIVETEVAGERLSKDPGEVASSKHSPATPAGLFFGSVNLGSARLATPSCRLIPS
jgi:hypothetical protein